MYGSQHCRLQSKARLGPHRQAQNNKGCKSRVSMTRHNSAIMVHGQTARTGQETYTLSPRAPHIPTPVQAHIPYQISKKLALKSGWPCSQELPGELCKARASAPFVAYNNRNSSVATRTVFCDFAVLQKQCLQACVEREGGCQVASSFITDARVAAEVQVEQGLV